MGEHYDVIVLGIGGMGSAALMHLALRGKRVLGLEQFSPAHALGSSHGQSRIIRLAYFEDPSYVPLLRRSYQLWADLEQRTGASLLLKTGGLMAGDADSVVVTGAISSAKQHGLPHEVLSAAEICRRFPVMQPLADEWGVYEPDAGVLFPEDCILAHLQVAIGAGAEARFGTRVLSWQATPEGGVRLQTTRGELEADQLVITAGPWFSQVAPELGLPLKVGRNLLHWFTPRANGDLFSPDRFPIWILQRQGVEMCYGFPALFGQGIKVAFHPVRNYTTPAELDRQVAPGEVAAIEGAVQGWIPDALGGWLRSAACMYTMTPDEHFVIGTHPQHPQVVLAGGFSGHGYKFCSVVGEILADLCTSGTTRHEIGLFSPTRFLNR